MVKTVIKSKPGGLLILALVLLITAFLIAYLPNLLFTVSIFCVLFLLLLFLARPWAGLLFLLLVRASMDITKNYFSVYLTETFQITGATALSFVLIIGGLAYLLSARKSIVRPPLAWIFLLFLAISLIHFLLVEDLPLSLMEFFRFFSAYIVYLLVYHLCATEKDIRTVVNTILLSSLIPIGAGLYQAVLNRGQFITGFIRAYGTFAHPNPYAFYLIIVTALAVNLFLYSRHRAHRFSLLVLIGSALICVLLSFSRSAWFSLLMIFFVVSFFRQKKLLWVFFALILIFGILSPIRSRFYDLSTSFNSLAYRLSIWEGGIEHLPGFFLVGRGLGGFAATDVLGELAHNDYLRVLVELGVFGLMTYLILNIGLVIRLGACFRLGLKGYIFSTVIAAFSVALVFLGISAINNILFRAVLQWYFWALMGVAFKGTVLEEKLP